MVKSSCIILIAYQCTENILTNNHSQSSVFKAFCRISSIFGCFSAFFFLVSMSVYSGLCPVPHFLFGSQKGSEKGIGGFAAFCFLMKTAVFREAELCGIALKEKNKWA